MRVPTSGPAFGGTFLIHGRPSPKQIETLKETIQPDEAGAWNVKHRKQPVYIIQNKDNAKDQAVFQWLGAQGITAPVSYHTRVLKKTNGELSRALNAFAKGVQI